MDTDISILPESVQNVIQKVLKADEQVLWFHRAEGNLEPFEESAHNFAVIFTVLLAIGVFIFSMTKGSEPPFLRWASISVSALFLIGAWMGGRQPAQNKKSAEKIVYMVTNQRALHINGNSKKDAVDSWGKEYIEHMFVEKKSDGRGSIIFENSYGRHPLKLGFHDIPSVAKVANLLRSIDAKPGGDL